MQNDELRQQGNREELVQRIVRAIPRDGSIEPTKGFFINRASSVSAPIHWVTIPSICLTAQGSKDVFLAGKSYRYDPYHYLLASAELPVVSHFTEATPERPHLSLRLELDASLVASVMLEAGMLSPRREITRLRALDVSVLDAELLDAFVRLVRLVEKPATESRVLFPLVMREIVFRLLMGTQGARLRQIAVQGGQTDRIARAIEKLRNAFDQPLRIETLARELGMSPSGFHEHFKAVTAMSPLQFQKHLRLQEARRLLLGEDVDAATVAYRVGYEDASHFSREYKRHFGQPPMRDVEQLRATATASAV